MTILSTDIKLLASERMTDTSDGGGRRTSNVIPDGVAGNIFPQVSRLDSVYGRVNLRKIYGAVATTNLDVYAGAMGVIMDAPDNARIHVTAFSTGSDFDDRTAARDRIESYVTAGPESRMVIYGRQLIGQGAVLVYQRPEETLPEVGDVFCLSKESGAITEYQQYIRVTDVSHEVRTLTDDKGDFSARIITLKIASTLRYEFVGPLVPARYSAVARASMVRLTTVADAARYFGISKLTAAADAGDLTLSVASVYTPIVPTTSRETAVSNVGMTGTAGMQAATTVAAGWAMVSSLQGTTEGGGASLIQTKYFSLPRGIAPGSLQVKLSSYIGIGSDPSPVVTDDGKGTLGATTSSGRDIFGGTVDYASGLVTFTGRSTQMYGTQVHASYVPATEVTQSAHTRAIPVTLGTRGTVYAQTLAPLPLRGSLVVDFRALGKWYRLRDDGTGVLSGGDAAYGTGSIDYATGAAVITLGALPDVDSGVMLSWGSPVHYTIRVGGTSDAGGIVEQSIQCTQLPIKPGSLTVAYTAGATTYTATSDVDGLISGGGLTGTVDHASGAVNVRYATKLPNVDTLVTVAYEQEIAVLDPVSVSSTITVLTPSAIDFATAIAPKGLRITVPCSYGTYTVVDDGIGGMRTLYKNFPGQFTLPGNISCGTVNYTTGMVSLTAIPTFKSRWDYGAGGWSTISVSIGPIPGSDYAYTLRTGAAATYAPVTLSADPQAEAPLTLSLTRTVTAAVVPDSVIFTLAGKTYLDRNGTLYAGVDAMGAGTVAGTINYASGLCTLSYWADNTAHALSVVACTTRHGDWTAVKADFRTAGTPLRPASFYVQATSTEGDLLTAYADEAGTITGPMTRGTVNNITGVAHVEWGELVTAAGNEAEPWFDAAAVTGGMIWRPRTVAPDTLRYNCVVLSNLPLNADVLGLDPVRLPSDGRVPIYRPADVVVIHNTKNTTLANPVVAGATYSAGRADLSDVWLFDAEGARVATTHYAADLSAGTITMAADLDLGATPQPLVLRHRIEEMNLLSDVQINGLLSLTGALSRDYDADTRVSSALLFGDVFARVTGLFDQSTWTGTWSNALIGGQATGQYNSVDYPVEVWNTGCVTERWRISFTNATAYQLIGEQLGVIATGTTAADLQVNNTLTGLAYFTLRAAGWGAGWAAGNQLRFNTVGATPPLWLARTVLPGATLSGDSFDFQLRGDVDA